MVCFRSPTLKGAETQSSVIFTLEASSAAGKIEVKASVPIFYNYLCF